MQINCIYASLARSLPFQYARIPNSLMTSSSQGPGVGFGPEVVVGDDPFRHAIPGFENHQVLQLGQVIDDLQDAFALAATTVVAISATVGCHCR